MVSLPNHDVWVTLRQAQGDNPPAEQRSFPSNLRPAAKSGRFSGYSVEEMTS